MRISESGSPAFLLEISGTPARWHMPLCLPAHAHHLWSPTVTPFVEHYCHCGAGRFILPMQTKLITFKSTKFMAEGASTQRNDRARWPDIEHYLFRLRARFRSVQIFLLVGRLQMNIEFLTAHLLRPLSSIKLAGADQHNRLFTFQGLTSDRPMRRANQILLLWSRCWG